MNELNNTLGKKMTAQEVAEYLGVDAETVRRYYHHLGGIRLGRLFLFFENLIIQSIRENSHALQEEEKEQGGVDSGSDARGKTVLQDFQYQDRGARLGIRNKKSSRKRLDDPFGILDAH
jgi:excisionase family DNA binding protein